MMDKPSLDREVQSRDNAPIPRNRVRRGCRPAGSRWLAELPLGIVLLYGQRLDDPVIAYAVSRELTCPAEIALLLWPIMPPPNRRPLSSSTQPRAQPTTQRSAARPRRRAPIRRGARAGASGRRRWSLHARGKRATPRVTR
ncbi:MAG TPA: hypothetical protein VGS80_07560 [Ktedonobacterales bacterium]|nr:hypothetical protein [Ktedonobacterales bacterium]